MAAALDSIKDATEALPVKAVPLTNGHPPAIELEEDDKHQRVLKYAFLHLVGYKSMTLDQLKSYHSDRTDSICPGHPEIENEGIELTTGPLGQGVANSVGLAMATKQLAAMYNKPDIELMDNHTWCSIGDACLQEGVALEAIQLAGHWKLNNLTLIYDNNQVSCDGTIDMVCTEDVNAKMRACGWKVIDVLDGTNDVRGIVRAMIEARASDLPTFINVRTVIGVGSNVQGKAVAHGVNFGKENTAQMKRSLGLDPDEHFYVPQDVYDFFHEARDRGERYEAEWAAKRRAYADKYPDEAAAFDLRVQGKWPKDWKQFLPAPGALGDGKLASRKSSGKVLAPLLENLENMVVGTADLTPSVNLQFKGQVDFQNPDLRTKCGLDGNYAGRYVHYGIREHAMCSIANGLAAFRRGTFLPLTSSFFIFYIYAAAGVRMGALQGLKVIHVATHDSIGGGPDGPTHQPVELAALYRAMPGLLYFRPCDGEEVAGAYAAALEAEDTPSIVSLSRHALPQWPGKSRRDEVARGAYVFVDDEGGNADVTLIGVGSEMQFAVGAREALARDHGVRARVISFPCWRLFERQDRAYRRSVLYGGRSSSSSSSPSSSSSSPPPVVAIEAYTVTGWERWADAGYTMRSWGASLPEFHPYAHFGFEAGQIAAKVAALVQEVRADGIGCLRGDFRDLNGKLE